MQGGADVSAPVNDRRGFLRQLAGLPLIGGAVTLIGQPTAAAVPVSADLLEAYKTWLHFEERWLCWEMAEHPEVMRRYRFDPGMSQAARFDAVGSGYTYVGESDGYHRRQVGDLASDRAALVLSAVGCDWRERAHG